MRRYLAALLVAPVAASLPLSVPGAPDAGAVRAQEAPTLRLTAPQELREADAELSWAEVPGEMEVEFVPGDALPIERVPVHLVAVAVRDGEVVGRTSTTPSVVGAGEAVPASRLAGDAWPAADDLLGEGAWSPVGLSSPDEAVTPEADAAASALSVDGNAAGVLLFAAPAADELAERFRTRPVVVAAERAGAPPGDDPGPSAAGGG